MKKLISLTILIFVLISCNYNSFELPKEYTITKYSQSDSIINNYILNNNEDNKFFEFTTLFGFKLCVNPTINEKIYRKKLALNPFDKTTLYINNRIRPLSVTFDEFNDKTYRVWFHGIKYDKHLLIPDNLNLELSEKIDRNLIEEEKHKEIYLKTNEEEESLKSNFDNLFKSLTEKYGVYNFKEHNIIYNDEGDIEDNFYWIVKNTIIRLQYIKSEKIEVSEKYNLDVLKTMEYIDLRYENITISKLREKNDLKIQEEEIQESNKIRNEKEQKIDDLNRKDQDDIIKNL